MRYVTKGLCPPRLTVLKNCHSRQIRPEQGSSRMSKSWIEAIIACASKTRRCSPVDSMKSAFQIGQTQTQTIAVPVHVLQAPYLLINTTLLKAPEITNIF